MLQIFENKALSDIAKPAVMKNAAWAVVIHSAVLAFLLSLALAPTGQYLPTQFTRLLLVAPPPPPPPPPPPLARTGGATPSGRTLHIVRTFTTAGLVAPVAVPKGGPVLMEDVVIDAGEGIGVAGGVAGGSANGVLGGIPGGVIGGAISVAPPPPPPPPPPAAVPSPPPVPERVVVPAGLQEAQLIKMVRPEYPPAAKIAHVQGTVRMQAVIDRDGNIIDLKVIDGHVMLAPAARAAVEQWHYRPYIINGHAVEVATEILVVFRLG